MYYSLNLANYNVKELASEGRPPYEPKAMFKLCVDEESITRIIDAFVERLDIRKFGVKDVAAEGRPSYASVIRDMKVETVRRKVRDGGSEKGSVYGSQEEMLEKAGKGYFVRVLERNLVYCPAGKILRQKCIKKNGNIRYANKNACKHCPKTVTSVTKEKADGKKLILQKTSCRNYVKTG